MAYRELDPRTELEQRVAEDLRLALGPRGATVIHHGTPAQHAPASAPADITVDLGGGRTLLVEVARRTDASEFQSIVSHLDDWIRSNPGSADVLYSGTKTSARMVRLVRNENQRRKDNNLLGRIIFLKLDDLEAYLDHWKGLPSQEAPLTGFLAFLDDWEAGTDDLVAAQSFQAHVFPAWREKEDELLEEAADRLYTQQEALKKDIQRLENDLRKRGIVGARPHRFLIYLFFMALFEDKRGYKTRATAEGFSRYRDTIPLADRSSPEFHNKSVHYLMSKEILAEPDIKAAGIDKEYEPISIDDKFFMQYVIPVFEKYSFANASIDAIGAVFEALARRSEKDNRIGQFFTPETAVSAATRMTALKPNDTVADPACGTGRFLIRAMDEMIHQVMRTGGANTAVLVDKIKTDCLLGTDIDPWIAVIAKMNMYIHGDGKSNIRCANGLTLQAVASFAPERPNAINQDLDVVVTNPPLGDVDFVALAETIASERLRARTGGASTAAELKREVTQWTSEAFVVIPHKVREEIELDKANEKLEEWRDKRYQENAQDNEAGVLRAERMIQEWNRKRTILERKIAANDVHHVPAGTNAKGGALFLNAIADYLRPVRDPNLPVEWRGGTLGIILDEAILNTPDYKMARVFIRGRYFIKAVVSLPREAFKDLAKTTAKTSIVILTKKPEKDVVQREPVFYARADSIGPSGKDIRRPNDLIPIVRVFERWRDEMIAEGNRRSSVAAPDFSLQSIDRLMADEEDGLQITIHSLDRNTPGERLDEAYHTMRRLVEALPNAISLSDVADLVQSGRTPAEKSAYPMATIARGTASVRPKGEETLSYRPEQLQTLKEGDVLISGIDLVHGAVGVVPAHCAGMVVSKEFYLLRVKKNIDPYWLVALLRTKGMRRIIEGTVTGTSNRTRVESSDVLLKLPLPVTPDFAEQKRIGDILRRAHAFESQMGKDLEQVDREAGAMITL